MRKFKFFISLDKEERWLNEMAKQGYNSQKNRSTMNFNQPNPRMQL